MKYYSKDDQICFPNNKGTRLFELKYLNLDGSDKKHNPPHSSYNENLKKECKIIKSVKNHQYLFRMPSGRSFLPISVAGFMQANSLKSA